MHSPYFFQIQAAAYGAGASGLYPATAMTVPPAGGNSSKQYQQNYGTQRYFGHCIVELMWFSPEICFYSYGSGYDTGLGQGNKDFGASSYSGNATGKSSGATGSSGAGGAGKGEYRKNAITNLSFPITVNVSFWSAL